MSDALIVIVDEDHERGEAIRSIIQTEYGLAVERNHGWEELSKFRRILLPDIKLLIMSAGIAEIYGGDPWLCKKALRALFIPRDAMALKHVRNVLLLFKRLPPSMPDWKRLTSYKIPKGGIDKNQLVKTVHRIIGPPKDPLPVLRFPGGGPDALLEQQLRALRRGKPLDEAYGVLRTIARAFWKCDSAEVTRLTQGFSGALVLGIQPMPPPANGPKNYVLKIVPDDHLSSLKNEVNQWRKIKGALNPYRLTMHLPNRHRPRKTPLQKHTWIVQTHGLCAVAYQCLGKSLGAFPSLEQAYRKSRGCPEDLPPAEDLLSHALDCLSNVWYTGSETELRSALLWQTHSNGQQQSEEFLPFPPYTVLPTRKAHIVRGLEQLEEFGEPLFSHFLSKSSEENSPWEGTVSRITSWLTIGPQGIAAFARPWTFRFTPVHGDLNKSNMLFWAEDSRPFFIDFTTYQDRGHVLQDLAQLETEVKLLLMDREWNTPLLAFDHTHTQLKHWCEAEDRLASPGWDQTLAVAGQHAQGIVRAYEIVRTIRQRARDLHGRSEAAPDHRCPFLIEYSTALLFFTLRVISFEQISPFKRLLAVYSSARLIDWLSRGCA